MRSVNIEQLEAHVLNIDFGDHRKVESVKSEYDHASGSHKVVFLMRDGDNTAKYTLRVPTYNILNPNAANPEAFYADQMRRWVVGQPQFLWMPL